MNISFEIPLWCLYIGGVVLYLLLVILFGGIFQEWSKDAGVYNSPSECNGSMLVFMALVFPAVILYMCFVFVVASIYRFFSMY
jgi:hypothetical protein